MIFLHLRDLRLQSDGWLEVILLKKVTKETQRKSVNVSDGTHFVSYFVLP